MDTSGQERYRSINENYYRNADCCLLVYDITNVKSFEECKYYSTQIKERCKKNIKVILLGNKMDLEDKRKIDSKLGADLALKNKYIFMETSCLKMRM
jgi:small GTP-binding protein